MNTQLIVDLYRKAEVLELATQGVVTEEGGEEHGTRGHALLPILFLAQEVSGLAAELYEAEVDPGCFTPIPLTRHTRRR